MEKPGVKAKVGPPLRAMYVRPRSSKVTVSTVPSGTGEPLPWRMVFTMRLPGKIEV